MKKLFYLTLIISLQACYYTEEADLLIHNAKVYTVDTDFSIAEALAVKDGKIIDVGANNELKNRYQATKVIDAKNQVILPGFIDAHCHFLYYGHGLSEVDLVGTKSWIEVIERLKSYDQSNPSAEWIIGRGWDQNDWEDQSFPTKVILDSVFPETPVFLKRIDGHAALANSKALEIAQIDSAIPVKGGTVVENNGQLSGLLIDNAIQLVGNHLPEIEEKQMETALLEAQDKCFAYGITTVDDAGLQNNMVKVIDRLQQEGKLKMNVYGMLAPTEENKKDYLLNGPYLTPKLSIRSFKYYSDGALGSRGALLKHAYHDDPGNLGLLLGDSSYFLEEAKLMKQYGYQMNTHSIGDSANKLMLAIYGEVLEGTNDLRWRIEHAQVVSRKDLNKFAQYNIIPSIQPTHATSDMYWLEDRLGKERAKTAYTYKDLLEQNGLVALGTDFPVEDINPFKTFYAAVARKDMNEYPESGFQMENALSREETIRGMTIWAAISNFEEDKKGSIEKGKIADFIILDKDLLEIKESDILKTNVVATFVAGELVFEK